MRLLMLSSDSKIFDPSSSVARRMVEYGTIVDDLEIVVIATGTTRSVTLASNVVACTTGGASKFAAFLHTRRMLRELIQKKSFDLVTAQDPFFIGLLGYSVAKKNRIPFQVQLHTDCFSLGFLLESPRRVIEVLVAIFILGRASCIRTVSERVAKSVARITSVPITVLPIFTAYTALPRGEGEQKKILKLVSVSRLTEEKRIHLMIDAVASVPDTELTIVGDGPLKKSLEFRVQGLGLEDRVRFVGWQDPAPYYRDADVFVHMSRYEGYGIALVEAARSRLAIITTDVGVVGEMLENEKSALVVAGTRHALKEAIVRLKIDEPLRQRLGEGASSAVQREEKTFEEYLSCYQSALSKCSL